MTLNFITRCEWHKLLAELKKFKLVKAPKEYLCPFRQFVRKCDICDGYNINCDNYTTHSLTQESLKSCDEEFNSQTFNQS